MADDAEPSTPDAGRPAAPQEIELKLRLPAGGARALLRHPALAPLRAGPVQRRKLVSIYFDTPEGRLAREGVGLRVRRSQRRWLQTLKGPARAGTAAGLAVRDEFEWPLAGPASRLPSLDLARIADTPWGDVVAKVLRKAPLGPRFVTEFVRTALPLRFAEQTTALLCIDRGSIVTPEDPEAPGAPRRSVPIDELEIEIVAGDPARAFELALVLCGDLGLRVETLSKAARGFALVDGAVLAPAHAEPAAFAGEASTGEALATILASCIDQVAANRDGLLASDEAEWIHQMRVGVRRLRSAFDLLRDLALPLPVDVLRDEARWLGSALGPARDLDVFVGETVPSLAATAHHAPQGTDLEAVLALLAERAGERLVLARDAAREAVASARFEHLLLSVGQFALALAQAGKAAAEGEGLATPARRFASQLLDRRARKLKRRVRKLARLDPSQRHEVRVAAKKLRYAVEFFAPMYAERPSRAYRKTLAELQALLGRLNDAATAAVLAETLDTPQASVATLLAGWAWAQGERHAKALARAGREFEAARAFWEHA